MAISHKNLIIIGLCIVIIVLSGFLYIQHQECQTIKILFENEMLEHQHQQNKKEMFYYFQSCIDAHDRKEHQEAINYCEKSREYNLIYRENLAEMVAELPVDKDIFVLRRNNLKNESHAYFYLYEAAEYFEGYNKGNQADLEQGNKRISRYDEIINKVRFKTKEYEKLKQDYL